MNKSKLTYKLMSMATAVVCGVMLMAEVCAPAGAEKAKHEDFTYSDIAYSTPGFTPFMNLLDELGEMSEDEANTEDIRVALADCEELLYNYRTMHTVGMVRSYTDTAIQEHNETNASLSAEIDIITEAYRNLLEKLSASPCKAAVEGYVYDKPTLTTEQLGNPEVQRLYKEERTLTQKYVTAVASSSDSAAAAQLYKDTIAARNDLAKALGYDSMAQRELALRGLTVDDAERLFKEAKDNLAPLYRKLSGRISGTDINAIKAVTPVKSVDDAFKLMVQFDKDNAEAVDFMQLTGTLDDSMQKARYRATFTALLPSENAPFAYITPAKATAIDGWGTYMNAADASGAYALLYRSVLNPAKRENKALMAYASYGKQLEYVPGFALTHSKLCAKDRETIETYCAMFVLEEVLKDIEYTELQMVLCGDPSLDISRVNMTLAKDYGLKPQDMSQNMLMEWYTDAPMLTEPFETADRAIGGLNALETYATARNFKETYDKMTATGAYRDYYSLLSGCSLTYPYYEGMCASLAQKLTYKLTGETVAVTSGGEEASDGEAGSNETDGDAVSQAVSKAASKDDDGRTTFYVVVAVLVLAAVGAVIYKLLTKHNPIM